MKLKKIVLLGLLVFLISALVLTGCSPGEEQDQTSGPAPESEPGAETVPETDPGAEPVPESDPEAEPIPESDPAQEIEATLSGTVVDGVREINVVASRFEFEPEVITVRQGEEVRLLLTTDDVAHGIAIREFDVDARIDPGETAIVTFVPDTSGEFPFFCSVSCGSGHGSMTGQLVVI